MFEIDLKRIAIVLIPIMIRKPRLMALVLALTAPLRNLQASFNVRRIQNLYRLNHNGQVCYLEGALNDAFDPDQRRIYIAEGDSFSQQYIYTEAEQNTRYLGTIYLRGDGDYEGGSRDFIVVVPDDFNESLYGFQIRAMINFYKLASKRYEIIKL